MPTLPHLPAARRHPWRRTAAAVLLTASLGTGLAAVPKASGYYEDALTRYEKRDYGGAILQLKNALQADKTMLPVHVLLGKALLANGDVVAAEVAFTEALRLGVNRAEVVVPMARSVIEQGKPRELIEQPRFAAAGLPPGLQAQLLLLRAAAYGDIGDPRGGMKAIEEARSLDPGVPDSWLSEVPMRIRARQLPEALAAADKALGMAPDLPEARYLRGTVLHVQGDRTAALAAYDRALEVQPAHTEALVARAGLLMDYGRTADAARDVAELLRTSPREPRGKYLQALIAERQGDAATAKAALNDVTALLDPVPTDFMRYRPQLLMLGGMAHYGLNQKEKAKPYLEAVQRAQPSSPASKLLAQIYLSEKNIDRAIESLDAYIKGQPNDAQAVHLLASAHMSQGRYTRATQLMQEALKLQEQPNLRTLLGLSLLGGGRLGDAVTELEAALRKDPTQIQAGTALATIYMQSGAAAKAIRIAEALHKQQPGNAGLLNLLGSARASAQDSAGARAAYEQAAKIDPAFAAPRINLARLDRAAGAYDQASARLDAVLRSDDKNVDALGEFGLVHELRGQLADAQRWLEKADDHSGPENVQAGLALIDFLLRNKRPDAAREATRRITTKAPEDLQVLQMLARVNLANGDAGAARTNLTRAATLANYDVVTLVRIALLQLQAKHLPGAAYSLDKALAERPDYLPAQALMTEVEIRQGELAKAERRARQIVTKAPRQGVGHALLGDVASARRDLPAAIENYRRAHHLDQSTDSLLRLHGVLGVKDRPAAQQLADQWLKAHPRDVAARRAVADAHARDGNIAAARSAYEALLKVTPDDAEALNNYANVLILAGDNPLALKAAELALQRKPGTPYIIGTAGWAAFKSGQTDRALQLLRDARLRDPANPDTRYFLSAVLASVGRKAEAREELEAALSGGRSFASARQAEQLLATLK